jgi:hypothetical protein
MNNPNDFFKIMVDIHTAVGSIKSTVDAQAKETADHAAALQAIANRVGALENFKLKMVGAAVAIGGATTLILQHGKQWLGDRL